MKRLIISVAVGGALWLTGCVDGGRTAEMREWAQAARRNHDASGSGSSSSGIDPVTMAGIEASNRATQEQADETWRANNEAAAQASADTSNQAANQAAADAGQAAINAANAGAGQ